MFLSIFSGSIQKYLREDEIALPCSKKQLHVTNKELILRREHLQPWVENGNSAEIV